MLILFNKPFGVLSQFTDADGRETLADYIDIPNVYPAGRLDKDSEGLLLLTDDGRLQARISDPKYHKQKHYWAQVDGEPEENALEKLRRGVRLKDGQTKPAEVSMIDEPDNIWPRTPPIRVRQSIPTQWLELIISEGKNRQVRRMTAAVNHPTLRLIRHRIGDWSLQQLQPGQYEVLSSA